MGASGTKHDSRKPVLRAVAVRLVNKKEALAPCWPFSEPSHSIIHYTVVDGVPWNALCSFVYGRRIFVGASFGGHVFCFTHTDLQLLRLCSTVYDSLSVSVIVR